VSCKSESDLKTRIRGVAASCWWQTIGETSSTVVLTSRVPLAPPLPLRLNNKANKLRGLSPRPNYTHRAKLVPTFADRGFSVVSATDLRRILGFLGRSRKFVFQVAPQLYSQGSVDPVLRNSGSSGNQDLQTTEAGSSYFSRTDRSGRAV
jgi:hypothetical protein